MSSSSVGRPKLASWSFNSSPRAVRIFVILEYPSSPSRPFSRASSVESPTLAFFASMGCVRPSVLRLVAICSPNKDRGNTRLIYEVLLSITTKITLYTRCLRLPRRKSARLGQTQVRQVHLFSIIFPAVYGGKTYQLMVPYWPDIGKSQSETKAENEFARTFDSISPR